MVTRKELAELLMTVNVKAVAKLSGMSEKTIYRLRNLKHSPSLDATEKLLDAIRHLKPVARK